MGYIKQLYNDNKRLVRGAAILLSVFAVIIAIVCFEYYDILKRTVFEESSGYISELSRQASVNADKVISDNYAILDTVHTLMKAANQNTIDSLRPLLERQKRYWKFENFMFMDEAGVMLDMHGKASFISDSPFIRQVIVERKNAASTSQLIDGIECVVFAIPIEPFTIGDSSYSALCATYRLDTFDQIIDISSFGGRAYAHIVNQDGTVVVRSSSPNADPCGYNLIHYLQNANEDEESLLNNMLADFGAKRQGIIKYTAADGAGQYISYCPVGDTGWFLVSFIPVSVVNANSTIFVKITLVFCLLMTGVMISLMVLLITNFVKHNRRMERFAFEDPVTKGNTQQKFQLLATDILARNGNGAPGRHAMLYLNVKNFKVINEQFGRESGNAVLTILQDVISAGLSSSECMGRIMADHFCILIQYQSQENMVSRFEGWHKAVQREMERRCIHFMLPALHFGVYIIDSYAMPIPLMIDRAKLSGSETVSILNNRIHYSSYDEKMHKKLIREKQLEDRMDEALEKGEFEIYLQPKLHIYSQRTGGAEALIRWTGHPDGMIYPDEFIPLFEKNGFIIQMDLWVFDQVCRAIQGWIQAGYEPVPVSVNCSRLHLKRSGFIESYQEVFQKYNIPPRYIEIELTESMLYEDTDELIQVINRLHEIGFTCSIDDFGSGYSSLNMIQYIPVDTLKLDRIFFKNTDQSNSRAVSIIGSIINMAQALAMTTVAEGVEEEAQVKVLKDHGCDYVQGYVYARPMPVKQFETFVYGKDA